MSAAILKFHGCKANIRWFVFRCVFSFSVPLRGEQVKEAHSLALPDYSQVRRASDSSCNVNTFKERTKLESIYKNAINSSKPPSKNSKTSTTNLSQLHKELVIRLCMMVFIWIFWWFWVLKPLLLSNNLLCNI